MKKMFFKSMAFMAVCFAAVSFTSCNDDEGSKPIPFESDMIGQYAVDYTLPEEPEEGEEEVVPEYKFEITPTWRDPENIPEMEMFGFPMTMDLVVTMMQTMAARYVGNGLDTFEFKNDGTFSVKYHSAIIAPGLDGILNPSFSTDVIEFPNAETETMIPAGAISYYTANNKLFFAVNRAFLKQIGEAELGMDLDVVVGGLIEANPSLKQAIVVSETNYALPLNYTINADKTVTIWVDKVMMTPILPVIQQLLPLIPEEFPVDDEGTVIMARQLATDLLNGINNEMTNLKIAITLKSK